MSEFIEVIEYADERGVAPFALWLDSLHVDLRARILSVLVRVRSGNLLGAKSVGGGVSEFRLDFGPGYRIYFGRDGERWVILLGGGTKKRQQRDIATAQQHWQSYKQEKQTSKQAKQTRKKP